MPLTVEQQLQLQSQLADCVLAVDTSFPTYEELDSSVRSDQEAYDALDRAAAILNAAASAPLIAKTHVVDAYAQIAARIRSPEVSDPHALRQQIGRLAIGKPVLSTPTHVHPPRYDALTYDYTTESQRTSRNAGIVGVLLAEPTLEFTIDRATHPKLHALTMVVDLRLAQSELGESSVSLLPAHAASLAVGQGAIRSYLRALTEAVRQNQVTGAQTQAEWVAHTAQLAELRNAVASIYGITPLLRSLRRPSVDTSAAEAVIATGAAEAEARMQNRPPIAPRTNRRHAQNIRAQRVPRHT